VPLVDMKRDIGKSVNDLRKYGFEAAVGAGLYVVYVDCVERYHFEKEECFASRSDVESLIKEIRPLAATEFCFQ
jgi:hypothetical protein